jgi:multidrug efflux system membrane fusion protein
MKKVLHAVVLIVSCAHMPWAWSAELLAQLQWAQRVELSTPVSGQVSEVMVHVGDQVKKGDPLLRLDDRGFKAQVTKARADVAQAKDALEEAKRETNRSQELFDRTVLSVHDLQLAKLAQTRAEYEYSSAQTSLELSRLNLEYSVVRAPFNGVIIDRQAEPGQTVVTRLQTTPLLVLAQADRMLAHARVDEDQLHRLRSGQKVSVAVFGKEYPGTIKFLGLEPETIAEGLPLYGLNVEFAVPEATTLRAGQKATIMLP